MRTVMLIGSLAMVGSGIFCLANGSAAFISVAFVIGVALAVMGLIEIIIGRRADFDVFGRGVGLTTDGIILLIFGLVVISGQISDDATALMLFAMWLLFEAMIGVGGDFRSLSDKTKMDNSALALGVAMLAVSLYMFFNSRLLDINAILLIGVGILLLGLRRFKLSFDVVYDRPGFLTNYGEKLEEAMAEEKQALAKAKEGIREQKAAQKRIEKIKEEMQQERNVLTDAAMRRQLLDADGDKTTK